MVSRWRYLQVGEAAERIAEAIAQRKLVVLLASCTVSYEGRAVSRLGEGERLILIKPDGCTLVHRPYGSLPVNYQPEGSLVSVRREEGAIVIVSARVKPSEKLVIRVTRVLHLVTAELVDNAEFEMGGSEHEIRDAIAEAAELLLGEKLRPVEAEAKLSGTGFADLLMVDEKGNFVVVEVKRDRADVEAVYQLKRYVEHLRGAVGPRVRGILAAPSISRKAYAALGREGLEYRRLNLRQLAKVREGLTRFLTEEGCGVGGDGGGVHNL